MMKNRSTMNQLTLILCITCHFVLGAFVNLNYRNILPSTAATKRNCNLFMSYLDSLSRNNEGSKKNVRQDYNWNPSPSMTTGQDVQKQYNDDQSHLEDYRFEGEYENPIQASFKVGDKVRVISGGYTGNVGHVVNVYPDMVKVELSQTRTVLFEIQQIRNLTTNNNENLRLPQHGLINRKNSNNAHFDRTSLMSSQGRENLYNDQRSMVQGYYNNVDISSGNVLSSDQVNQFMREMKMWEAHFYNNDLSKVEKISRKFKCRNFQSALEAVNTIGLLAENSGYRLDLHVTSYHDVEMIMYTKGIEGLVTLDDIELVKAMEVEITTNYST